MISGARSKDEVRQRTEELHTTRRQIIRRLSRAMEYRERRVDSARPASQSLRESPWRPRSAWTTIWSIPRSRRCHSMTSERSAFRTTSCSRATARTTVETGRDASTPKSGDTHHRQARKPTACGCALRWRAPITSGGTERATTTSLSGESIPPWSGRILAIAERVRAMTAASAATGRRFHTPQGRAADHRGSERSSVRSVALSRASCAISKRSGARSTSEAGGNP